MRRLIQALVLILIPGLAAAGNSTLTYTAAQSTQIQNRVIKVYNKDHCAQFGFGAACTSANLVTGGCVTKSFKTLLLESCTIFTLDAAGEQAFHQETHNQALVGLLQRQTQSDASDFNTTFQAMTLAQQNAICDAMVPPLPKPCTPGP